MNAIAAMMTNVIGSDVVRRTGGPSESVCYCRSRTGGVCGGSKPDVFGKDGLALVAAARHAVAKQGRAVAPPATGIRTSNSHRRLHT
jgi:hypothetical protein